MTYVYPAAEQLEPTKWVSSERSHITYKINLEDVDPWKWKDHLGEKLVVGTMVNQITDYIERAKKEKRFVNIGVYMGSDLVFDFRLSSSGWYHIGFVANPGVFNSFIAVNKIYKAAFNAATAVIAPLDPMDIWLALNQAEYESYHRGYAAQTPHSNVGFSHSKPSWPNWQSLDKVKTDPKPIVPNLKMNWDLFKNEFIDCSDNWKNNSKIGPFEKFALPIIKNSPYWQHQDSFEVQIKKLEKQVRKLMGYDDNHALPTDTQIESYKKEMEETKKHFGTRGAACNILLRTIGEIIGHDNICDELTEDSECNTKDLDLLADVVAKYLADRADLNVELALADHEIAEVKKQTTIMADKLNESQGENALNTYYLNAMRIKLEKLVPQEIPIGSYPKAKDEHDAALQRLNLVQEQLAKAKWWMRAGMAMVAIPAISTGLAVLHTLVM